ncbi:hypothetical protein ACHAXN_011900 [Cyclotella atomus]
MRLITGDELGLLKETIPELCRPPPTDASGLPLNNLPSWMMGSANVTNKRVRPSATSIQAAASAYGDGSSSDRNGAVNRLENEGVMTRDRGVVSLTFVPGSSGSDAFQFAALRMNGTVEKWAASRDIPYTEQKNSEANITPARYRIVSSCNDVFGVKKRADEVNDDESHSDENKGKGWYTNPPIKPIGLLSTTSNDKTVLAAGDSSGAISILNDSCQLITNYRAYEPNDVVLSYTKGGFANNHVASCIAVKGDALAVGGRERGVRVLDLESGKCVWKAKNMPPDPQTLLQQPLWTTALQFIHSPHNHSNGTNNINESNNSQNLLASGTAYKQVQIYDVRSSSTDSQGTRRPILHTPQDLLQHRVTSLLQLPNSNQLIVADAIGDCHIFDLRKFHTGKQASYKKHNKSSNNSASQEIGLGRLVGPGGSIRQLAMHPTLPMVACVGLDRKLWSWDIKTKRMVDCVYLRQRLNCLLICEDEGWNYGGAVDVQDDDNERIVEGDDWEEEGDEVCDYVDSENEDVADDETGTGSSSDGTESESNGDKDDDASSEEEAAAPSKRTTDRANKKQKL